MRGRGLRVAIGWLVVTLAVVAVTRLVVALPEECSTAAPAVLDQAIDDTVGWFAANQQSDGTWLYRYRPATDEDLGGYNWVRHAGVMLSLYQAAAAGEPGALDLADRGRSAILERQLTSGDGWTALADGGRLTAGGTALLVAALAERRALTGATDDDDLLRALGTFLVRQVEARGSVLNDARPDGTPVPDTYSPFSTGEVMFALAQLHLAFPGDGWDEPAARIADYVVTERATVEGYVPDNSDHWSAYGFAVMRRWPERAVRGLTDDELGFARRQQGIMSIQTRYESQRTNRGVTLLRGRQALGAALGTIGEAMGQWWLVGAQEPALDGGRAGLRDRIECMAGTIAERRIDAAEAARFPRPDGARGAQVQFGVTQMDDQQHTLSALLMARSALSDLEPVPKRDPLPTNAWVTALAALAALNPVRLASGAAGDRRRRVRDLAVTGAVVTGVCALLAAIGGPLLRGLDISVANGVVAAGLVLVAGAAFCMVRPDEARPGGFPVPLLVPLGLRPDLLVLAVVAGAGGRGVVTVGAIVLGAAAATAITAAAPLRDEVRRWLMRLVGTIGLVTAIALVVDGVYAI